jgi:hypothetical protein
MNALQAAIKIWPDNNIPPVYIDRKSGQYYIENGTNNISYADTIEEAYYRDAVILQGAEKQNGGEWAKWNPVIDILAPFVSDELEIATDKIEEA